MLDTFANKTVVSTTLKWLWEYCSFCSVSCHLKVYVSVYLLVLILNIRHLFCSSVMIPAKMATTVSQPQKLSGVTLLWLWIRCFDCDYGEVAHFAVSMAVHCFFVRMVALLQCNTHYTAIAKCYQQHCWLYQFRSNSTGKVAPRG